MIAYLEGTVQLKQENALVVNVRGVGYLVRVSEKVLSEVEVGQEVILYIHTAVSENDIALYGFLDRDELRLLKLLISVSGIGPRSALGILNQPVDKVEVAIFNEDLVYLTSLPGVGKKTAERLVVELKSKVMPRNLEKRRPEDIKSSVNEDALEALLSLGYSRQEALVRLSRVPTEIKTVEGMIKMALKG